MLISPAAASLTRGEHQWQTVGSLIVAATGDIYAGLRYPVAIAVITLVVGTLFVRETKDTEISARA